MGRLLSTDLFSLLVETFVSVSIVLLLLSGAQPGRRLMCSGVKIRSGPLRPGSEMVGLRPRPVIFTSLLLG
jgi:hypothetical protein